jgi:hypothetical protein
MARSVDKHRGKYAEGASVIAQDVEEEVNPWEFFV